ncbi:MAG: C1 family peptidase [Paludibacter sp.]
MASSRKTTPAPGNAAAKALKRSFDVRPDTLDFRDRMFIPTLVEVPEQLSIAAYEQRLGGRALILDQGEEGACSGFALAATCNYLLRTRKLSPDKTPVSPHMLYETARLYDEWRGENYEGSSARGAMKGWHKHGVCAQRLWPAQPDQPDQAVTRARAEDAARRPLGAYFRVNHKDLVAMHAALAEVGILFATSLVHKGWGKVKKDGRVPQDTHRLGAHAFAIIGYDARGFWFQNSWAKDWGQRGFGHLSYADWLDNGMDVWVARLGAPVIIDEARNTGARNAGLTTSRLSFPDLRPHIISIGNNGAPRQDGTYGNSAQDIERILQEDLPRITASWKRRRILLYAHGGLVAEANAIQRVENYLPALLKAEVYPLAFIWRTDFWSTVKNLLADALRQRRPEGALDAAKDFMLDRLDDTLEPIARLAGGKRMWDEMKENALLATLNQSGGARLVAEQLQQLLQRHPDIELHVAGHSAGSIFMAPLVQLLSSEGALDRQSLTAETGRDWAPATGMGATLKSCTMWAAACSTGLFDHTYLPAIRAGRIERFTLFNLKDQAEQDDHCAQVYNKSLLYMVSNAFEKQLRAPLKKDGQPILGMDKFVTRHTALQTLIKQGKVDYVLAPNETPAGDSSASTARHHGDFDDDTATVKATLARILGRDKVTAEFSFARSSASLRDKRKTLEE